MLLISLCHFAWRESSRLLFLKRPNVAAAEGWRFPKLAMTPVDTHYLPPTTMHYAPPRRRGVGPFSQEGPV